MTETVMALARARRALGALLIVMVIAIGGLYAWRDIAPARALDVPLTGVSRVVLGEQHACALMQDKTVKCWGQYADNGQLGIGDVQGSVEPVTVDSLAEAFNIGSGDGVTCVVLPSHAVSCWGKPLPARVVQPNGTQVNYYFINSSTPAQIPNLDGAHDTLGIDAGAYHACALLNERSSGDRFVVCWGSNAYGQLGNSTTPFGYSAADFEGPRKPVEFPPMTPVKISAGANHTCALAELGHVACWGAGAAGQIGDGHNMNRLTAELVDGIPVAAVDIAAGSEHSCAVLQDGRVQCWGLNDSGQLGDTTLNSRNTAGLAVIVNAAQITAGAKHTCAVTHQRTVLCWGANGSGQLGDGTQQRSLTPQLVPGLADVVSVAAGGDQTCAVLADTAVFCWGNGVTVPAPVVLARHDIAEQGTPVDLGDILSDMPDVPDQPYEYGDAPDQGIDAYAGVRGRFPTLDGDGANGPKHANPFLHVLGDAASIDAAVDADGLPNVITSTLTANLDGADDGWLNARDIARFDDCQTTTLRLRVRRAAVAQVDVPLYLNAWIDGNRDGDWRDTRACGDSVGYEWMVQNYQIPSRIAPAPGAYIDINVPTQRLFSTSATGPAWVRISLSDRPAITPAEADALPDGRGLLSGYFGYGETEDYLWDPLTPREQYGDWEIRKTVDTAGAVVVGSTLNYTIEIRRSGGSQANVSAALVDVLPAQTSFVSGVTLQQLSPSANPASAVFEAGYGGPNGRVRWLGTLTSGAHIRLRYQVRVDACTTAPVVNEAHLVLPGSGKVLSSTVTTPLACTPPPPASFTLSKQLVDVVGASTFSGGAQISETVYLLTLSQSNAAANLAAAVQDTLPTGLTVAQVSASRGALTVTNAGRTVNWLGVVGPSLVPPQIWIRARVISPTHCGRDLLNTAQYAVRRADGTLAQGISGEVIFRPGCTPPPTSTPLPTNTATPRPTYTPVPVDTYTPVPRPTNTSVPVATNTSVPHPTYTPVPVATNTSVPLGADNPPGAPTNTPVPRPTNTSVPAPSYTPVPALTNTPVPVETYTPVPRPTNTSVPLPPVVFGPDTVRVLLPLVAR